LHEPGHSTALLESPGPRGILPLPALLAVFLPRMRHGAPVAVTLRVVSGGSGAGASLDSPHFAPLPARRDGAGRICIRLVCVLRSGTSILGIDGAPGVHMARSVRRARELGQRRMSECITCDFVVRQVGGADPQVRGGRPRPAVSASYQPRESRPGGRLRTRGSAPPMASATWSWSHACA
jgi:hypothetical protein